MLLPTPPPPRSLAIPFEAFEDTVLKRLLRGECLWQQPAITRERTNMSAIDVAAGRARRMEPIRRTGALGRKNAGVRICLVSKNGPVIDPCEGKYRRSGGLWDLLN